MIDDEDEDHVPRKDTQRSHDDEFARSVRVRDAARRAFIAVDTDQRLCRAAVSASRTDQLIFEPGDLRFLLERCNGLESWHGCRRVSSRSRPYALDSGGRIFKQQAGAIVARDGTCSLGPGGCARIPGPLSKNTDHVIGEPELPPQSSQSTEHGPQVDAPVPEQRGRRVWTRNQWNW